MNEFLKILTHARRLQAAVKDLSVEELEQVKEKLESAIENRKAQEAEARREAEKKQALKDAILKQMQEAGLDLNDLAGGEVAAPSKRVGAKRPVKYKLTDKDGEHTWTGIGRMPKVFAHALEQGKKLQDFAI
ncbi:H-NS family nucleoid-associated regulatory protein [Aliiglaciecola sp. CAU 1673]|uniref:H-NS histone family protein n=1 Tax=Aliiglaciecola sp. CAU 1673 TaxID=3032595 RepID=UPI0023DCA91B|nr:H-NS family nucleoid-associated regulatory protein [Aliiglaciecola sp. CAU 1673]MDF2179406.1 H-NS family nucleoid-associated regulatory protein [Aliiglaciecola sp. CAU 1673]